MFSRQALQIEISQRVKGGEYRITKQNSKGNPLLYQQKYCNQITNTFEKLDDYFEDYF